MNDQEKLGQESAFPFVEEQGNKIKYDVVTIGMSKRFYAACAAMQGILSNSSTYITNEDKTSMECDVKLAYKYADELLKQEEKNSINSKKDTYDSTTTKHTSKDKESKTSKFRVPHFPPGEGKDL